MKSLNSGVVSLYSDVNFVTLPLSVDTNNNARRVSDRLKDGGSNGIDAKNWTMRRHRLDLPARLSRFVRNGLPVAMKQNEGSWM